MFLKMKVLKILKYVTLFIGSVFAITSFVSFSLLHVSGIMYAFTGGGIFDTSDQAATIGFVCFILAISAILLLCIGWDLSKDIGED